jgi:uncharacterized protein involved in exopolysaccharide biosynthesis
MTALSDSKSTPPTKVHPPFPTRDRTDQPINKPMNPTTQSIGYRPALGLVVLAAFIAFLTITTAQERPPGAASSERPNPRREKSERTQRAIRTMEKEADEIQARAQQMQRRIDQMKVDLSITDFDMAEDGLAPQLGETLRALDRALVDAQTIHGQLEGLFKSLKGMTRPELRQALPTASPDLLLSGLMQNLAEAQQKQAVAEIQYGKDNPEIISLNRLVKRIETQIEERVDGIMAGMEVRAHAHGASLEQIQKAIDEERLKLIAKSIQIGSVLNAIRELNSLRTIQERLNLRLQQEKLDALLDE